MDQRSFDDIMKKAQEILDAEYSNNNKVDYVYPDMLNEEQRLFYDIMEIIMKTFFCADSEVSASDGGSVFYRGVYLKGKGSNGK